MNIFLKSVLISILWMITANTVADDHASDSNPAVAMQVHEDFIHQDGTRIVECLTQNVDP